ncbi:2-C-methyl-D-erythritol 4-phosphate cytidylyltransferase [uncultured Muribaculum sp.]|uniref:IspD/TarI family cytidylyltransferase n=1 Tax=uncultured Muribaculum sp. TaxID=1918613 RepID=UPI0025F89331|nr:2-C-methyl-D-erythritol 4-phosphate cytidylyltransferase [uncultured Muribaculum sp.]
MCDLPNTFNIIVAAGSGSRFGAYLPKQFCLLAGRPVLFHTIEAFRRALPGGEILLVISDAHRDLWHGLCDRHGFESPLIVGGGASRWESVRNAVMAIEAPTSGDVITVHDGARPLVSDRVIREAVIAAARDGVDGAVPAVPVTDSVRMLDDDGGSVPLVRQRLRAVQTPQAFPAHLLREAYELPFSTEFTDDASVMSAAGHCGIVLTEGSCENIKITHPDDLALAEMILARREGSAVRTV